VAHRCDADSIDQLAQMGQLEWPHARPEDPCDL
jgi:hypothetical protein